MKMAEYDLTYTISKYLDRHMVLPLLEFLQDKKLYPEDDLLHAKLELVSKTKMVDFAAEEYKKLNNTKEIPPEMDKQRLAVYNELSDLKNACQNMLDVISDVETVTALRKEHQYTLDYLVAHFEVSREQLDQLYHYAKLNFDCGRYRDAADYLAHFRLLSKDEDKKLMALWGKLAAEILMTNWEVAFSDLEHIRDAIDKRADRYDPLELIEHRTWLIHWSLFIFFNLPNGRQQMIDFLFQEQLLTTIQINCPHILRYLTCAVIINYKRKKNVLKDIVRVIIQEKETYSDPIVEFLRVLYVEFDFDSAHIKLGESQKLLLSDFFLGFVSDDLVEQARQLMFETYGRIHCCIEMNVVAKRLNIEPQDAERDIVELIRNGRLDIKLDSNKNQIIMDSKTPAIYQQIIDKTEALSQRSNHLFFEIDKKYNKQQDDNSS